MNYLKQLNAFYLYLEINTLSPAVIALWLALMHANNKARWRKQFTVSMQVLHEKTGFERKALTKARQQLAELGLIKWEKRGNNQAACYQMIPFDDNFKIKYDDFFKDYNEDLEAIDNEIADAAYKHENEHDEVVIDEDDNNQQLNLFGNESEHTGDDEYIPPEGHCGQQYNEQYNEQQEVPEGTPPDEHQQVLINKQETFNTKNETIKEESVPPPQKFSAQKVFMLYKKLCPNLVQAKMLDKGRKRAIINQLKNFGNDNMLKMLQMAGKSKFLAGENQKGWKASIDWLMHPANFVKVLDGNYSDSVPATGNSNNKQPVDFRFKPSSIEVLEEAYNNLMTDGKYRDIN